MPRRKQYPEKMQASFPEGTFERIELQLDREREDRTDFVREAVDLLLTKREREARK
ncbi:MAG: hypothetical protein AAFX52_11045 [Pseudomonadota bacterium]